jgi:uncharacterized protein with beta-barrel porin domain
MRYVSTLSIRFIWALAFWVSPLAAIGQAEAACSPNAPVSDAIITCAGITNGQNGTAGYGTNADTGNTITVQSNASVTGIAFGVILQTGTLDNFGGIFGGLTSGIGVNASILNVTNSGAILGGTTGINAGTANVNNSGNIFGQTFGIFTSAAASVTNSGTIQAAGPGVAGISANIANVINSGAILARQTGITSSFAVVNNSGTVSGGLYGVNSSTVSLINSGSIFGGTAGILAATAVVNNSGSIAGGVGIQANSASGVINSGTITGTGGTAISFLNAGNTLTLGPGSIINGTARGFGADTFQLGGTGTAVFNASLFSTQYSGYATFNKIGASTWALTGTNVAAMPWTVSAGTLNVNGALANSTIMVNGGGILSGNGTIGNTTINGGTLAPDNSIGLLTVQGSLVFTAASTYMVEVSPTNADRTNITATATLGGATVNAVFLPGSSVKRQYTILNATAGVSGSFNPTVVSNNSNIQATVSYDANDVFLNTKLNFVSPSGSLTVNQQNVANALTNFFNSTGSIPTAFAMLSASGLAVTSGELGTGVIRPSIKADDLFLNLLLDPTISGRAGGFATPGGAPSQFATDDGASAYAARRSGTSGESDAYTMATKAPLLPPQPFNRWSVWAAGYGGSESVRGDAVVGSQNTNASVWGVTAGADYKVVPDSSIGFAVAGGGIRFSLANGLGSGSSDLFQAGVYGRKNIGQVYLSAALAYGWHDVTTNRTVALAGVDMLQGRFGADTFSGRFEAGYRFVTPVVGITPYASAEVVSFHLPAYAEQSLIGAGLFALSYDAQTTTDTRTELGLRSDKSLAVQDGVLTLRGRLAWVHDYNPNRAVVAIFQALPSASFAVNGASPDRDSALVSAGAEMKWLNGFSLAVTFGGEVSGNVTSYAGRGIARYAW